MDRSGALRRGLLWGLGLATASSWCALIWSTSGRAGQLPGWVTGLLLCFAVLLPVLFAVLRRGVFQNLDELTDTVAHWGDTEPEALRARLEALRGPAGELGDVLYENITKLEDRLANIRQEVRTETEREVQGEIARGICESALPNILQDYPSRGNFEVAGLIHEGKALSCTFYDYFYIDPGLLCIAIGQMPDGSVPDALFMVVAQTTIRSRLRQGHSLAETMAEVNTQLYDLGESRSVNALVGTLNTSDGRFNYVNAGGQVPMLMKNEQDYEWLKAPVYAPLGLNQNVSYRTMDIRLRQGDRLFLYTEGLGAAANSDGAEFREQSLRTALNLSRTKSGEPAQTLTFLSDEAEAYCDSREGCPGYASVLLEFRKGDRELAHCKVINIPEQAPEVMDFLKERFSENGIQRRNYVRFAVLADEMFSLCCRKAVQGSLVTVECGVAPDGQSVTLRFVAQLQGFDPLAAEGDDPAGQAASFINEHVDYATFKSNPEGDVVTLVCFF